MSEQATTTENESVVNLHAQPNLQEIQVREDVILRPMEDSDAPAIIDAITADPSIRDRVTMAARINNEDDVKREIIDYESNPNVMRYAIIEGGQCVGLMSLWRDDGYMTKRDIPHAFGFGFFLTPTARGRGLVTDGLKALAETARANLRIDSFIAFCEDDNDSSIAALNSIGLKPTETTVNEPNNGWTERFYEKRFTDDEE